MARDIKRIEREGGHGPLWLTQAPDGRVHLAAHIDYEHPDRWLTVADMRALALALTQAVQVAIYRGISPEPLVCACADVWNPDCPVHGEMRVI